jgi:tRNA(Ile)-lysidine synthase
MKVFQAAPHHPLHKQVAQVIRSRGLLQPGQKVLVAVSGGADSVAMLSLLHAMAPTWHLALTVVHCNYGLRGPESEGDARFVSSLCRQWAIPCLVRRLKVGRERGATSSLQARARDVRYRLFRELADHLGANRVAIGHTADDQAETVLLRMLRGTGLRGLAAMAHIRNDLYIRPLLDCTRSDILAYLKSAGLSYRTDSSNLKTIYRRNRVRHELMPVLRSFAPNIVRMLARQADLLREDDRVLVAMTRRRLERAIRSRDSTGMVLDRAALLAAPAALQRRMLQQSVQALSPYETARSDQLMSLLKSLSAGRSGGLWRVGAVTILCCADEVRIRMSTKGEGDDTLRWAAKGPQPLAEEMTIDTLPSTVTWHPTGAFLDFRTITPKRGRCLLQDKSDSLALFDAERLVLPLRIRTWREGDWFCPTGMRGRRKKLQDYFTDAKLAQPVRKQVPLLLSDGGIAWIVGFRVDDRVAATTSTTRFIVGRMRRPPSAKGAL